MTYTCTCCGRILEEWPALTFNAPIGYSVLSEKEKAGIAELSADFCIVRNPDQTDRFIRATLSLKVMNDCRELDYGIWVSLSEESFENYSENFGNPNHTAECFGWLSNLIPGYELAAIPTTVVAQLNNLRPRIVPDPTFDHQLVRDYYDGITQAEAERRINEMLNDNMETNQSLISMKPWWKFW